MKLYYFTMEETKWQ